jgi:hypothetical protein
MFLFFLFASDEFGKHSIGRVSRHRSDQNGAFTHQSENNATACLLFILDALGHHFADRFGSTGEYEISLYFDSLVLNIQNLLLRYARCAIGVLCALGC